MHYMDPKKTIGEKARFELHKNIMHCLEQILEATAYKQQYLWGVASEAEINS